LSIGRRYKLIKGRRHKAEGLRLAFQKLRIEISELKTTEGHGRTQIKLRKGFYLYYYFGQDLQDF